MSFHLDPFVPSHALDAVMVERPFDDAVAALESFLQVIRVQAVVKVRLVELAEWDDSWFDVIRRTRLQGGTDPPVTLHVAMEATATDIVTGGDIFELVGARLVVEAQAFGFF
ncbi:hypothetical protein [Exiguobacterium sp. s183]|uniref:hypothetical protein n=1 Tax=Exiguobacterium sp. s183 TaxID=2751262 RepID=UPI001BE8F637|nr:hypothetical protein [Exiguobacterium sp. s183]